ncbi:LysM peptidoglycan-binding domain-containing protein [uncultured Bacteroides sp.]|uniref:LysM peptidoglycan-binding domain-containing protein n=1 Tax=uncultured Bacteroides sp. TaxID=162156 RepID=UPI00262AECEA|nr:LysM peptidoglycan-binding domain-containing protein [uncultured Bacteroides sp.]
MKFIHTLCLAMALSGVGSGMRVLAQSGTQYFMHTITKGQGLYSISRMYNVTIEDIVKLNPGSDEGIRAGEQLKIPQKQTTQSGDRQFHTIQAGETLYQLTVKYKISAQEICSANPGLSASNFRIGQVIVIPAVKKTPEQTPSSPAVKAEETPKKQEWKEMHKVKRKETIFSISQQYGITQEELIAANPELKKKKLKKGSFIFIPYSKAELENQKKAAASAPTNEELFSKSSKSKKKISTIKVALMIPFTTSAEEKSRMIEFYEGFLIAVDSLKQQGVSMDIYTYDTKGSVSGINNILKKNELKEMDIIIGPVNQACIPPLTTFSEKNDIRLVIPFAPKVDQVFKSPNIYQVNTPQSYLYSEVYEHFIRKFKKANVVFLNVNNGDKEKMEFVKGLKTELAAQKIDFKEMTVDGSYTNNSKLLSLMSKSGENLFIPTSGRASALTKIVPLLTTIHRENADYDMHLFGYPEWQTYTGDYLPAFYELDTYFYSSFYTNNLFPAAVNFSKSFRRWYSKDMANTYPKYGMLGFDIGYFFLKGLSTQGNKLEDRLDKVKVTPIQTGFKFERVNNWGGFINRKVFFVHFTRDFELIKLDFD